MTSVATSYATSLRDAAFAPPLDISLVASTRRTMLSFRDTAVPVRVSNAGSPQTGKTIQRLRGVQVSASTGAPASLLIESTCPPRERGCLRAIG
jgi:hypothetical protein